MEGSDMSDDLTNSQIALLCAIEEHDDSDATSEEKRDLARLLFGGLCAADRRPSRLGL